MRGLAAVLGTGMVFLGFRVLPLAECLAIGILAAAPQFVQTIAHRLGTTHQVAPFGYLSLVFAIILGWVVFGNVPDLWSFLGMAMITVAGLALVFKK